jgi:cytidyltransferase-like protein
MKVVVVSGGFDPIHSGHLKMLEKAKALGDRLVVALNSDDWLTRKKGQPFMPFIERAHVLCAISFVDNVMGFDDSDNSAREALRLVKARYPSAQITFANGGDRTRENIPEMTVPGVEFVFGVGGDTKTNSSSKLLDGWRSQNVKRPWGSYEVLKRMDGAKVKTLRVRTGRSLSMQRHLHRAEYWTVVSGRGRVYGDGLSVDLGPGSSLRIPVGSWHQLYAFSDMEIVEVQFGSICEESDIERKSLPHSTKEVI